MRLTKGSGLSFKDFQKMRTMISRMSKQAGLGGPERDDADEMVPALAGSGGNRDARRAAKTKGED
ncbi:hypothetical protein ACHAW5_000799 [Stephanodiscus triporus]|uniref:Signal recognition particle SRP54 subunit M-domain domain-containing protein n=1 Tax=Stephanodiscus triporus TaxID=2934178 RepID=A0ABD3MM55_9STRA